MVARMGGDTEGGPTELRGPRPPSAAKPRCPGSAGAGAAPAPYDLPRRASAAALTPGSDQPDLWSLGIRRRAGLTNETLRFALRSIINGIEHRDARVPQLHIAPCRTRGVIPGGLLDGLDHQIGRAHV